MLIVIAMPGEVEARLRELVPDLDRAAREAVALDLFRAETISIYDLRLLLGLSRSEVNRFLLDRGELAQSPTLEDLEHDFPTRREPAAALAR